MQTHRLFRLFATALMLFCLAGTACTSSGPILIGYASQLTGLQGELGVAGRNGAQMAIDEINQNGGIGGRVLKLLVADDHGEAETARSEDQKLLDQGVVAIIGHTTSSATAAVFEMLNQAGVVLFSPTASSINFSRQKDYFFRVIPGNDSMGRNLAAYIFKSGIYQIAGIYDLSNQTFTETFWREVQREFTRLGGDASQVFSYTTGNEDLKLLIGQVTSLQPEGLVFVASAVDVALMAQYGKQAGLTSRLFSSPWANTKELIEKGGRAVEGLTLLSVYHPNHPSAAYQKFIAAFTRRYGTPPSLGASHSYEAVMVLAQALKQTKGSAKGLPEALLSIQDFEGLQGKISFDEDGDVRRELYVVNIENGQATVIEILPP
jgi:branched-chain amino acid transport system substrate-binding protein